MLEIYQANGTIDTLQVEAVKDTKLEEFTGSIIDIYYSYIDVTNSYFHGQKGGAYGGVVGIYGANVNFINNIFKNNYAELGGAIYIDNANNVYFKHNQFLNNRAISH